jgi:hypothetical protein
MTVHSLKVSNNNTGYHSTARSCHISITQRQAKSWLCGEDISMLLNMKKYICVLDQMKNA